jgi:hypothetical protein
MACVNGQSAAGEDEVPGTSTLYVNPLRWCEPIWFRQSATLGDLLARSRVEPETMENYA